MGHNVGVCDVDIHKTICQLFRDQMNLPKKCICTQTTQTKHYVLKGVKITAFWRKKIVGEAVDEMDL